MNRRSTLRDVALIAVVCLGVRALAALLVDQPGYMDAYYYFHVARNLASGQGFVEQVLWNYLDNPAGLPHASNLYWMPLTSLLVAPGLLLFGDNFRAAQVPLVLISPLVPLIAYATARLLIGSHDDAQGAHEGTTEPGMLGPAGEAPGCNPEAQRTAPRRYPDARFPRWQWLAVALLTIFSGVYFVYWTLPDSFASFAILGALSLLCTGLGLERDPRWFVAASASAALAHLSRPDGILLLGVVLAAVVMRFFTAGGDGRGTKVRERALHAAGWCVAAICVYLLILGPWLARNVAVSGSVSPGTGEALFQREYNDLFRYGRVLTPDYYLDWGWQNILGSKAQAAGENLLVFAEPFLFYLLPFGLVGAWQWRRRPAAWPFLGYCALLYGIMTLAFTFPGPRGSYLHSMSALLPFYAATSVKGIAVVVHWIAGRLRHWVEPTAQRNFLAIAVAIAVVMSAVLAARAVAGWSDRFAFYSAAAGWLKSQGNGAGAVMVIDPPGWNYVSGRQTIMVPNEPLAIVLDVCRRYGVRYLVLEAAHPLSLHKLYLGLESSPNLALRGVVSGIQIYEVMPAGGPTGG